MKNLYLSIFLILFTGFFINISAQISFTDNTTLLTNQDIRSGGPIAVTDMDGDFLDDIVRLDGTRDLTIDYQQIDGTFVEYNFGHATNNAWAVTVADLNNDGFCELMAGGAYNGVNLLIANGTADYLMSTLDGPDIFVQGSNFADINNDGHLDAFACHDDGPSSIWVNDGNGNLSFTDKDIIDLHKFDGYEDNSGNYGSVWTDYDSDGDLDLYIAKCRQGTNSNTDVRRINQLWENDGDNNYTEVAADHGLAIGWQSWTAEFQDIDNDGDFDCFITNHDFESQLLENVDNMFIDITDNSGINVNGLPIEASMKDFDNDGFVDILVTGQYFHNNGDKTFTEIIPNPFGGIHSFGIGDLNHDGFLDVYAGYGNGFNGTGGQADKLWFNDGNDNNFLAVNLEGQQSNKNGIGARIELHGEWGVIVREVRSGESYGIGHSFTQHFGVGQATEIDALIVKWPSGITDAYNDITINQFVTLLEGNCISPDATLMVDGATTFCPGESVELTAPDGFEYQWSNGETSQSITVEDAGNYSVIIDDGTGCIGVSPTIQVIIDPIETVSITIEGDTSFCEGGSVMLTASESNGYTWSNGSNAQTITVEDEGDYSVTIQGLCSEFSSESVFVNVLEAPEIPTAEDVVIPEPSVVILTATGTNLTWYEEAIGGIPLGIGNEFTTAFIDQNTSYYVEDAQVTGGGEGTVGEVEHTGGSEYSGNQFNGQMIFDAEETFVLKSILVYTDMPGQRIIELRGETGEVVDLKTVNLEIGETVIDLDFTVEAGTNLVLTTNEDQNNASFGFNSPRLRRTSTNGGGTTNYPYTIEGVVTIKETNFGTDWFYYFYDWKIELPKISCPSPRKEVKISIGDNVAVLNISDTEAIQVFPNPTSGIVQIDIEAGNTFEMNVMDITGKVLNQTVIEANGHLTNHRLDMSTYAKGMYWLQFRDDVNVYNAKVVVQ